MKWVLFICAAAVVSCSGDEAPPEPILRSVRYVKVQDDRGAHERTFSGQVQASNQSKLSFQVPGRVQNVAVKVGDRVKEGQLIAALDPTDFQLQLQEARASLSQAQAQARSAEATYSRTRALYENKNASAQDLDNARAQKDSALSSVSAISQNVMRLKRQLGYATLNASAAGIIREVSVETNEVVGSGQVVGLLQAGEQLEVALDIPESYVNRVQRGTTVKVKVDSNGGSTMNGVVSEMGIPGAQSAAFPVSVRLETVGEGVSAGMAADVVFSFEASESAATGYFVPTTAVGEDREGRFVYVAQRSEADPKKGTVKRTAVETGGIETGGIEVRSGISPGDLVVTAGVSRIQDGLEVKIPSKPMEFAP